jgi:hypothetical protein
MESRSRMPSSGASSRHHHPDMIDSAGNIRLIRIEPAAVWHVVERHGDALAVTACRIDLPANSEHRAIPVESLLTAGRICLDCAHVLISAG